MNQSSPTIRGYKCICENIVLLGHIEGTNVKVARLHVLGWVTMYRHHFGLSAMVNDR